MHEKRDLTTIPPELMTAEERTRYVNTAFDRAIQGKTVTIQGGASLPLPPGLYARQDNINLTFTDILGVVWNVGLRAPFSLLQPRLINNPGPVPSQLLYYPERSNHGVPLHTDIASAGVFNITICWGGSGTALERTAGFAFVRAYTINGPMTADYVAVAGNVLHVSFNAYL